jgi:hypothetical protein
MFVSLHKGSIQYFITKQRANIYDIIIFQQTLEAWKIIFLSTAGLNILSIAVFVIFGRTSVQPWNTYWEKSDKVKIKSEKPN